MDDISVLMTYVSADSYLADNGHLGFVITQSVFKTEGGGEGFRSFLLPTGEGLQVLRVCDMISFQPFEGASNRTATIVLQKGRPTRFPVKYDVWQPCAVLNSDNTLEDVIRNTSIIHKQARPVSPDKLTSPWIAGTAEELSAAAKCFGSSDYQGRYGTHCHASGIYWVEIVRELPSKKALIRNLGDAGKKKYPVTEHRVDRIYLFPLARGRDIDRWSVSSRCWMLLTQQGNDNSKAIPETVLQRHSPDTFAYFKLFETALRDRSGYRKFFRPGIDPFYSIYNVGPYTFAPYKVLWREVAQELRAAVSGDEENVLVPDHTLVSVSTDSLEEAHYLCAMLNSSPSNFIVSRYVALHPAPHILKYIRVPKFNDIKRSHSDLADLSRKCHVAKAQGKAAEVTALEKRIDRVVASLWGLAEEELRAITNP